MEGKLFYDKVILIYLTDFLCFTFMSYSVPMSSIEEKMKRDFLYQEKQFLQYNRSHFTFIYYVAR